MYFEAMVSQLVVGVFGCGSFDFVLEQVVGAQFTIVKTGRSSPCLAGPLTMYP
jgi:hypothetical protein